MYNCVKAAALTAVMALGATAATSATYTYHYTEGMRDLVQGSVSPASTNVSSALPGFNLGTLNAGENIALHGRIETGRDAFSFTTTARVKVEWLLDGYFLDKDGSFESLSGYVAAKREAPGVNNFVPDHNVANTVPLSVTALTFYENNDAISSDPGTGSPFSTEVSAREGSNPFIISLQAGTYSFRLDARTVAGANRADALYDIKISAVPLPAGALLLLTGIAGLGIGRRRRNA